jgi:hypothetical protein
MWRYQYFQVQRDAEAKYEGLSILHHNCNDLRLIFPGRSKIEMISILEVDVRSAAEEMGPEPRKCFRVCDCLLRKSGHMFVAKPTFYGLAFHSIGLQSYWEVPIRP